MRTQDSLTDHQKNVQLFLIGLDQVTEFITEKKSKVKTSKEFLTSFNQWFIEKYKYSFENPTNWVERNNRTIRVGAMRGKKILVKIFLKRYTVTKLFEEYISQIWSIRDKLRF